MVVLERNKQNQGVINSEVSYKQVGEMFNTTGYVQSKLW